LDVHPQNRLIPKSYFGTDLDSHQGKKIKESSVASLGECHNGLVGAWGIKDIICGQDVFIEIGVRGYRGSEIRKCNF